MQRLVLILLAASWASAAQAQLAVVSTTPAAGALVAPTTAISVTFDRPLDLTTVNVASVRGFGRRSGPVVGTFSFSNGDQTLTLTPGAAFSAGETVYVNLSHDLRGADATALRAAGYAFEFGTNVTATSGTFTALDTFSNQTGSQTRIYGAAATDLDGDRFLDLATINEVSADVRVFLNQGDGSGLFGSMLTPTSIGVEASPNEPADFDNDGNVDLCVGAAQSNTVSILLGAGDGSFSSVQDVTVGSQPHGVIPIDVDGDGDQDVVAANVGSNDLALLLNDGSGVFAAPTFFEAGVDGEYSLERADMDGDGITDLVVAARNAGEIVTLLGNGNGTFSAAAPPRSTGGSTWVVVLGDVNGDGDLDAVTANDGSGNVGILLGNGDGSFGPVSTLAVGSHLPSVDLGDLDGDGDLDLVVSSFGGGFWRRYANDGVGGFSAVEDIPAPANPSCSVLFDFDNDGDLDMALTDEIADVVVLMENESAASPGCSPAPSACREPVDAGKSRLRIIDRSPDDRDRLVWSLSRGEATSLAELGDPLTADAWDACLYEDGLLVQEIHAPAGGLCGTKPCWKAFSKGYLYGDKELTPDGMSRIRLSESPADDRTRVRVVAKGTALALPPLATLDGTLVLQLQRRGDPLCFGARFTPPFLKNNGTVLSAKSDAPDPQTPLPLWSSIQSLVVGPTCASCHGGSGGLSGLGDCQTGHASLVDIASSELPTMDRVEPGDPATSWLMHKLDGTHGAFTAQCVGGFCGGSMPLGGGLLPLPTRDAVRGWITNGAVNDCP